MLIISRFHDFYDSAMTYGIDKSCVYNRQQTEVEMKNFRTSLPYSKEVKFTNDITLLAEPAIIGFCGKIYPLVIVKFSGDTTEKPHFFYDAQSYIEFMEFRAGSFFKERSWYGWMGRGDLRYKKGVIDFFSSDSTQFDKLFLENRTPIFSIISKDYKSILTINPRLESLSFMKVADPATAFQEIYMYQAGVLGNIEIETIEISDKVKLQQHGFDNNSFKTMKGDKKPRAKNRNKK